MIRQSGQSNQRERPEFARERDSQSEIRKTYRHEAEGFASARRIRGRHGRARDRLAFGALVELRRRGDAGAEGGGSHREHDDDRCECVLMTHRPASRRVQVSLLFRVRRLHRSFSVLYVFSGLYIVKMRGTFSYLHMSECTFWIMNARRSPRSTNPAGCTRSVWYLGL